MTKVPTTPDALAEEAERIAARLPRPLAVRMRSALLAALKLDQLAEELADSFGPLIDDVNGAHPKRCRRNGDLAEAVASVDGTSLLLGLLCNAQFRLGEVTGSTDGNIRHHAPLAANVAEVRGNALFLAAKPPPLTLKRRLEKAEAALENYESLMAMVGAMLSPGTR